MNNTSPTPKKRSPGGGARAADGVSRVARVNVMLDPESLAILERIGNGNLSLGVREAARRLQQTGQTRKFSVKEHEERLGQKLPK